MQTQNKPPTNQKNEENKKKHNKKNMMMIRMMKEMMIMMIMMMIMIMVMTMMMVTKRKNVFLPYKSLFVQQGITIFKHIFWSKITRCSRGGSFAKKLAWM